jgi:hypothetical protein
MPLGSQGPCTLAAAAVTAASAARMAGHASPVPASGDSRSHPHLPVRNMMLPHRSVTWFGQDVVLNQVGDAPLGDGLVYQPRGRGPLLQQMRIGPQLDSGVRSRHGPKLQEYLNSARGRGSELKSS